MQDAISDLGSSPSPPPSPTLLDDINGVIDGVVNYPVFGVPLLVLWLGAAGVIFTIWMRFVNLRAFGHAVAVVRGKFDPKLAGGKEAAVGDVSHSQALWTALSGTLGLGNIAGVVIAISVGGPGATFWMVLCGFFGMTLKFTECSLGQMFRVVDADGRISGGPMHYLPAGLASRGLPRLGKALGGLFAVVCIFSSFGAGNLFQVTQATAVLREVVPAVEGHRWILGLGFALAVGAVTLGGLRSVARVAAGVVPSMCALYLVIVAVILATNASEIPAALASIWEGALRPESAYGGVLGVLIAGMTRATFSNEAGTGSAAIAHAAATTEEPIRGGIVALLEPFIDTVVVCTMTAVMILILDPSSSSDPAVAAAMEAREGATALLILAGEQQPWTRIALVLATTSFALSTVLTWSYYGERCVRHVAGPKFCTPYRVAFVVVVFFGALVEAASAQSFADMVFLSLAFPNVLGLYLLAPLVKRRLDTYLENLRSSESHQG